MFISEHFLKGFCHTRKNISKDESLLLAASNDIALIG